MKNDELHDPNAAGSVEIDEMWEQIPSLHEPTGAESEPVGADGGHGGDLALTRIWTRSR